MSSGEYDAHRGRPVYSPGGQRKTVHGGRPDKEADIAQADRALSDYIQAHGREVDARVGEPTAAIALRLLKHREEVLESEKALHREDHEVLEIVTGIPGAHMWHPPTAKQWAQDRREEIEGLKTQLAVVREWMAQHRTEPVYSAAVADLSRRLNWADADQPPPAEPQATGLWERLAALERTVKRIDKEISESFGVMCRRLSQLEKKLEPSS